jgi:Carboxypeptidase regulatory-like domain
LSKLSPIIRLTSLGVVFLFSEIGFCVSAQQFTGTLQGTVQDTTGAVVVGAEVAITNQSTNVTINTTTSGNGNYIVPQLPPGNYRVTMKKPGFKMATVADIKIDVQQIRAVDITLDVGQTTETVSVSAMGAAALETTSTTLAQTIENKRIVDLPLNGRNPFSLATLSPGVIPGAGASPWISGGRNATSEVSIDGVSNVGPNANVSILELIYTPSVDSVQEFSVQTNTVSAEFGRLGGGVINLITKSGTNSLHLTAYEFMRNSKLDANNFFSNRAGWNPDGSERAPRGAFQRNQFGGNVGGPLYLPKLYDGRNRTFFFFALEAQTQRSASVSQATVPLDEWRRGDFSNLRNANGQPIIIYDPLTTRANPAFDPTRAVSATNPQFIRDPFRCNAAGTPIGGSSDVTLPICNKIPEARISPIARNLMKYWPQPNQAPTNVNTQVNNFIASGKAINDNHRLDLRIDHVISESWRLSSRFSTSAGESAPFNGFGNLGTSIGDGPTVSPQYSFSHDHTYALSPTLVFNARYGFGRTRADRFPFSTGFDITQLGFPSYVRDAAALQALEFPRINVNGVSSLGQFPFTHLIYAPMNHQFNASATKTTARHTFKWGMDYRKLMVNFLQMGQPSGEYNFDTRWT